MPITFTLSSPPPSVNNLFATVKGGRRIKSKAYQAWLTAAGWEIRARCIPLTVGPIAVEYQIERPNDRRRRDVANLEKALSDVLVAAGAIEDDSLIERVTIGWADGVSGVRVTVTALSDAKQGRAA
jgi:crossover junction endodeoxyribonuclease RusA